MEHYSLDPAHYYTAPGMAWQAALKKTKVELELIKDNDQYLFVENGIRGGVAMISSRHEKANLPSLSNYDSMEENKYLMYLDANNLYGWAMSQWLNDNEIELFDVMSISDDNDTGYIIECDLGMLIF